MRSDWFRFTACLPVAFHICSMGLRSDKYEATPFDVSLYFEKDRQYTLHDDTEYRQDLLEAITSRSFKIMYSKHYDIVVIWLCNHISSLKDVKFHTSVKYCTCLDLNNPLTFVMINSLTSKICVTAFTQMLNKISFKPWKTYFLAADKSTWRLYEITHSIYYRDLIKVCAV